MDHRLDLRGGAHMRQEGTGLLGARVPRGILEFFLFQIVLRRFARVEKIGHRVTLDHQQFVKTEKLGIGCIPEADTMGIKATSTARSGVKVSALLGRLRPIGNRDRGALS